MAASDISCGMLQSQCFASGLSLQYHVSTVGSRANRRHLLQLSHDTQLLLVGSCTDLARLVSVSDPALSRKRLGGNFARDVGAGGTCPSGLGAAISRSSANKDYEARS